MPSCRGKLEDPGKSTMVVKTDIPCCKYFSRSFSRSFSCLFSSGVVSRHTFPSESIVKLQISKLVEYGKLFVGRGRRPYPSSVILRAVQANESTYPHDASPWRDQSTGHGLYQRHLRCNCSELPKFSGPAISVFFMSWCACHMGYLSVSGQVLMFVTP